MENKSSVFCQKNSSNYFTLRLKINFKKIIKYNNAYITILYADII